MRLRCLGVISESVLEFGPGFTVVTGETGAGKTMVVTGLGLLLGGRADAAVVRTGARAAVVEGRVRVAQDGVVARRAEEAGGELDADELLLSRSVSAEGRSRAVVGGRSAPVSLLAELGADLVVVHGQTDQIRLRSAVRQREALDRFAGTELASRLAPYREGYRRWLEVRGQLRDLADRAQERAHEAELLRLGLAEVERVAPVAGEDHALKAEAQRLAHAEDLRLAAGLAHAALTGDPGAPEAGDVVSAISAARRGLDAVRDHDPTLAVLADRFGELGYLAADLAAECASYADSVEADPARLAAVEDRRAVLAALTRAHGTDVDGVLAWSEQASRRLLDLDDGGDRAVALREEETRLRETLARLAADVGRIRRQAARRLGDEVSAELAALSMPDARLEVRVEDAAGGDDGGAVTVEVDTDDGRRALRLGPDGADSVTMWLLPHPGAGARPLAKGASGGELSRVMLALEIVLGGADPVPTFVFDEVDAGVGGRAALNIGRRLATLARTCQVLVVTHLPQVAAFADRHLVVVKTADGDVTHSGVRALDDPADRARELARMLAGLDDSDTAQAHARELLEDARAWRQKATDVKGSPA